MSDQTIVAPRDTPAHAGSAVLQLPPNADFSKKVIEMTERAEEVVVAKTARLREEIVVRRAVVERVKTIRGTLRRGEVEVVRLPGEEGRSTDRTAMDI